SWLLPASLLAAGPRHRTGSVTGSRQRMKSFRGGSSRGTAREWANLPVRRTVQRTRSRLRCEGAEKGVVADDEVAITGDRSERVQQVVVLDGGRLHHGRFARAERTASMEHCWADSYRLISSM